MRRFVLFAALTGFSLLETSGTVERLSGEHQPMMRAFQESRGRARLVAILSPT